MSGGRYVLGIGAGNTPDAADASFGIEADPRVSRYTETVEIIHRLLEDGRADFEGQYHRAEDAQLVFRAVRDRRPPLVAAAGGPRMKRMAVRFADEWHWWTPPGDPRAVTGHLDDLARACDEVRCYLSKQPTHEETLTAIESMAGVVAQVHGGR